METEDFVDKNYTQILHAEIKREKLLDNETLDGVDHSARVVQRALAVVLPKIKKVDIFHQLDENFGLKLWDEIERNKLFAIKVDQLENSNFSTKVCQNVLDITAVNATDEIEEHCTQNLCSDIFREKHNTSEKINTLNSNGLDASLLTHTFIPKLKLITEQGLNNDNFYLPKFHNKTCGLCQNNHAVESLQSIQEGLVSCRNSHNQLLLNESTIKQEVPEKVGPECRQMFNQSLNCESLLSGSHVKQGVNELQIADSEQRQFTFVPWLHSLQEDNILQNAHSEQRYVSRLELMKGLSAKQENTQDIQYADPEQLKFDFVTKFDFKEENYFRENCNLDFSETKMPNVCSGFCQNNSLLENLKSFQQQVVDSVKCQNLLVSNQTNVQVKPIEKFTPQYGRCARIANISQLQILQDVNELLRANSEQGKLLSQSSVKKATYVAHGNLALNNVTVCIIYNGTQPFQALHYGMIYTSALYQGSYKLSQNNDKQNEHLKVRNSVQIFDKGVALFHRNNRWTVPVQEKSFEWSKSTEKERNKTVGIYIEKTVPPQEQTTIKETNTQTSFFLRKPYVNRPIIAEVNSKDNLTMLMQCKTIKFKNTEAAMYSRTEMAEKDNHSMLSFLIGKPFREGSRITGEVISNVTKPKIQNKASLDLTEFEKALLKEYNANPGRNKGPRMTEEERRRKNAEYARLKRARMTEEQKALYREKNAVRARLKRARMTEEERRRKNAEYARLKRARMTEEQKALVRKMNAETHRIRRASMTEEQKALYNKKAAEWAKLKRSKMTEEERRKHAGKPVYRYPTFSKEKKAFLSKQKSERYRIRRSQMTEEELVAFRERMLLQLRKRYSKMTDEERLMLRKKNAEMCKKRLELKKKEKYELSLKNKEDREKMETSEKCEKK